MTGVGGDPAPPTLPRSTPDAAAWGALPDDLFARVVPHLRRALGELEEVAATPEVRRLRALPASKLGRDRGRRRVLAALAEGGPLWVGVRRRLDGDPELVIDLLAALAAPDPLDDPAAPSHDVAELQARVAAAEEARDRARAQRDQARAERDDALRQRDGAAGREASVRDDLRTARARADELAARVDELGVAAAEADRARRDAVAREARRGDAARRGLEEQLAQARRELDEARRVLARRESVGTTPGRAAASSRSTRSARSTTAPAPARRPGAPERVVAGRPSRLPVGTRLDTREGAEQLLAAVPGLLVDGYNVTRSHRGDWSLERQRDWLVNGLAALAARRRLDVTVVFDAQEGDRASGATTRGVAVRFSHPGISADDEIVLAVELLEHDEALVVVTDDRELRSRLAPARVDLLGTAVLVGLLG